MIVVKFTQIDATEIDNMRTGRRGRVSYPILKGFLETGFFLAQLDRTGLQQSMQSLSSSLNAYIKSHEMPIKMFQRTGELYLMRLDIDENGVEIPNWQGVVDVDLTENIKPINPEEVAARFAEEKGKTTK